MRMSKKPDFNKIKSFVQEQVGEQDLLIRTQGHGFKVNDYVVQPIEDGWQVLDNLGFIKQQFFSRKYAVLSAVLLSKKNNGAVNNLKYLDTQMEIASQDQHLYNRLLKKETEGTLESIYIARLSRAKQILESVRQQIQSIEKSLQLQ